MDDWLSFLPWILLSWAAIHLLLSRHKNLPPGPFPLPIFGNLFLLMGGAPYKSMAELAKIHGPVMHLQLGSQRTVVISSASAAKEALHKNGASFGNREIVDSFTALQHHESSFLFLPIGDRWKSFRKIFTNHVFSRGRLDASQSIRVKKLDELLSYVKLCSQEGEAVDVGQVAFNTTLNILSNTFYSIDLADPKSSTSREFKEAFWQVMAEAAKPNLADYFPVLKCVDLQRIKHRVGVHLQKVIDLLNSIISKRVAEREAAGLVLSDDNDALDALLNVMDDHNSGQLELTDIPHLLLEIFVGGTDSTPNTIEWAMAELLRSPDKMKAARDELERVVGRGIPVKEEDIPRLTYLQAIIKETFRKYGPVPFISRKANCDVELCGFTVPKNSQILVNLWAIGKDPILWDNQGSFEPERFLGREIDVKGRDFELIPFGAGRRICPGLPLAMLMLSLMLGSLINCFDWKLVDGVEPESVNMDAKFGFTLRKAQPLRAIPIAII